MFMMEQFWKLLHWIKIEFHQSKVEEEFNTNNLLHSKKYEVHWRTFTLFILAFMAYWHAFYAFHKNKAKQLYPHKVG